MRYLDPAQLAAAKGTAAVKLTLAGPGPGKTSTLTGRFIHLVSMSAVLERRPENSPLSWRG